VPELNWDIYAKLPGDKARNFELLCRAVIRRHYGQFGDFRALANQPGVEFHLKLHSMCPLGEPGRWYGWQCKWYDLPSGRAIGATRRRQIEDAIRKTEEALPGLTDWVLWARYPLTRGDQEWFCSLQTEMRLHLWTDAEIEEHLSGPAEILRSTYFGELVLTTDFLNEKHKESTAPVKQRWLPEVHQIVDAERALRCALVEKKAWFELTEVANRLQTTVTAVSGELSSLPADPGREVERLVEVAVSIASVLTQMYNALVSGDYEVVRQELVNRNGPNAAWRALLRKLRNGRYPIVLQATNMVADIAEAYDLLSDLTDSLDKRLIAVVADAGCGKTQLAAQLTAPMDDPPAGVLLHGRDLVSRKSLDDLARQIVINGRPVPSFEALVAAVDAAGRRVGRRLPIVIDGLNEAEDPRDWKSQLASLSALLDQYLYVLVVCTLRPDFVKEALPEEMERLEIPGFEHDTIEAIKRYFQFYKIDPRDAALPWRLLQHPLTLRMFCEVTNPKRNKVVGVEAMPGSLTALFEKYLDQVAERIAELSQRPWRYYDSDVRTALSKIGQHLWDTRSRSLDFDETRRILGDDGRPWDQSIVRALEQEGVLVRVTDHQPNSNRLAIAYDPLVGHLVTDALLERYGGGNFRNWLHEPETTALLAGELNQRHPFASDIFRALVGLVPRRMFRQQFWPLLDEPLRTTALYESAWLDKELLNNETVSHLAILVKEGPSGRRDLLERLWSTRAAQSHPLNAEFLDEVLRSMSMSERDLRWTEWVRRNQDELLEDIKHLEQRWRPNQPLNPREQLRARWVMWNLTTTVRLLRDHATRALYWFGCRIPKALFDLTLDSLDINDPYVPERMLAACYGIAMSLWADPRGKELRKELPNFANNLLDKMFAPRSPYPTRHVLMREYALGVVDLAIWVARGCIPDEKLNYLRPPFSHIPSPFPNPNDIDDSNIADAEGAIHMDFGNYTIGGLIPDRGNYEFENPTYRDIRRQIEYRIVQLGYRSSQFTEIDKEIANWSWRAGSRGEPKTDRYGKKYSWIAYFEMYGVRFDEDALPGWRHGERCPDADIDPSFPEPARIWRPPLPDLFTETPAEPRAWITDGPTPDYGRLLRLEEVDGLQGPWVLLNGYIEQSSNDDERRVFTFLRGLLVERDRTKDLLAAFEAIEYPGNMAIPEPGEDYYTYAGEIPWSPRFAGALREPDGRTKRDIREAFERHYGQQWLPGIPVEVPVYRFAWESYHSSLNQVSGIMVPAPALCEKLCLSNRQGEWDFYDAGGHVATIYREFKTDQDTFRSSLLYLRADLMQNYLDHTNQTLMWLLWGEREFRHKTLLTLRDKFQDLWSEHKHIHRSWSVWDPQTSATRGTSLNNKIT